MSEADLEALCLARGGKITRIMGEAASAPVPQAREVPGLPFALDISEREFMAHVVKLAKARGFLVYHTYRSDRSEPGFLDLVMVREDRIVWAELKTEIGKMSAAQQKWYDALDRAGEFVYLWRPSDWWEIVEVLK